MMWWFLGVVGYLAIGAIVAAFYEESRIKYNETHVIGFTPFLYVLGWPSIVAVDVLFLVAFWTVVPAWEGFVWILKRANEAGKRWAK